MVLESKINNNTSKIDSEVKKVVRKNGERFSSYGNEDPQPLPEEIDEEIEADAPRGEEEASAAPASAMSEGFALDGALAEAAASASLLTIEAERIDSFGFAQEGEAGGGGWNLTTLLVTGAVAITGVIIWATSGGSNKPPTVDSPSKSVTVAEDDQINIAIDATDPDGDDLTYTVTTAPTNGSTQVVGNTVVYKPSPDYNGADSLTVTITDTKGQTVTQAVAITVTAVNDAPKFNVGTGFRAMFQAQTLSEDLSDRATDVDGDSLTFAAVEQPDHGTLLVNPIGTFVYTPDIDYIGFDEFSIRVSDNKGGVAVQTFDVSISPVPGPPVASNPPIVEVAEDSSADGQTAFFVAEGGGLDFTLATSPQHGRVELLEFIDGSAAQWLYTPDPDYNGPDSFEIKGTTAYGSGIEKYTVSVTPVNDAPTAPAERALTTAEDTAINVPLSASDIDQNPSLNNPVTDRISPVVLVEDQPANGVMSVDGDRLIYTPNLGFVGNDTFRVTYRDLAGASAKTTFTVAVSEGTGEPIDQAPTGTNPVEAATPEDTQLTATSDIADPDGDALSYALNLDLTLGAVTINQANGTYTYTPPPDFHGQDGFTIIGTANGKSFTQNVSIDVASVNDVPTVASSATMSITTPMNTAKSFIVDGDDADGDELVYVIDKPANGKVFEDLLLDPNLFTYVPDDGFFGIDDFEITLDDEHGGTVTYTVEVTVTQVEEVSLNGIDPSQPPGEFNAGTGAFKLVLDATMPAHIRVNGFGDDDFFHIINGTMDDFMLVPGTTDQGFFVDSVGLPMMQRVFFTDILAGHPLPEMLDFDSISMSLMRTDWYAIVPG